MNKVYILIHNMEENASEIIGVFTDEKKADKVKEFIENLENLSPYESYGVCTFDINKIIIDI